MSQHRQVHMSTHIYQVCNILFDLTIMLDFLIITSIITFDVSNEKQNLSHQIILYYQCTLDIDYISIVYMTLIA
jgi:hypothetical protein